MFGFIVKMIFTALAEPTIKEIIKSTIKEKVTSRTKNSFDDDVVDILFNSNSKGQLSRNLINYGANKLLHSSNDGINSLDINDFLETASKSKRNNFSIEDKNKALGYV